MGLDMYLTKKVYVGANYEHNGVTGTIDVYKNGEKVNVNFGKVVYIEEDAGYWRKANAIHNWFVENVQGGVDECQTSYVDQDDLKVLLELVNEVLNDHSLADELLPTTSGCFFGNTDYDEWYFNGLENTKEILENILEDESGGEYYYSSSW